MQLGSLMTRVFLIWLNNWYKSGIAFILIDKEATYSLQVDFSHMFDLMASITWQVWCVSQRHGQILSNSLQRKLIHTYLFAFWRLEFSSVKRRACVFEEKDKKAEENSQRSSSPLSHERSVKNRLKTCLSLYFTLKNVFWIPVNLPLFYFWTSWV